MIDERIYKVFMKAIKEKLMDYTKGIHEISEVRQHAYGMVQGLIIAEAITIEQSFWMMEKVDTIIEAANRDRIEFDSQGLW